MTRLTAREPLVPAPLAFSSDGTKLLAQTDRATALLWDLRAIRAGLTAMRLDWDQPPYPTPEAAPKVTAVEIVGRVLEPAARRAVERTELDRRIALEPGEPLGVVEYRLGHDAEAVAHLQESLCRGEGRSDAFDLFFLSMVHARLGHAAEAQACFDRAARRWDARPDLPADVVQELSAFRAEAETVLQDAAFPRYPFGTGSES